MKSETKDVDILEYPLRILSNVGLYSRTKQKRIYIFATVYLLCLSFVLSTIIFQFIDFQGDVFKFVSNFEGFCGFMQHSGKVLLIIFLQSKLNFLLDFGKYCWTTNRCPKNIKIELDNIASVTVRMQGFLFSCVTVAVAIVCISPVFGRSLPLGMWIRDEHKMLHRMAIIAQVIIVPPMGALLIGFDSVFMSLCAKLIIQFRILGSCFEELNASKDIQIDKYKEKIKICIKHHNFLIKFLNKLKQMFSYIVVVEYVTIVPLICSEMYVAFESDDVGTIIRYMIFSSTLTLKLAFYCIPADYVTSEALKVGDYLYSSKWFSCYRPLNKQTIPFVLQKSQQKIIFKGMGLFEINATALLQVLKICWSTCTLIRGLKQKNL